MRTAGAIALPPKVAPDAGRRILAAAAHASGRLAVVAADVRRVSVGDAPCCVQLLLYAPAAAE
jgi:hypothetical protein